MHKQKTPIYKLFRSKASKTQQVAGYKREWKLEDFFNGFQTVAYFSSRNNFANLDFIEKKFWFFKVYNSLVKPCSVLET